MGNIKVRGLHCFRGPKQWIWLLGNLTPKFQPSQIRNHKLWGGSSTDVDSRTSSVTSIGWNNKIYIYMGLPEEPNEINHIVTTWKNISNYFFQFLIKPRFLYQYSTFQVTRGFGGFIKWSNCSTCLLDATHIYRQFVQYFVYAWLYNGHWSWMN